MMGLKMNPDPTFPSSAAQAPAARGDAIYNLLVAQRDHPAVNATAMTAEVLQLMKHDFMPAWAVADIIDILNRGQYCDRQPAQNLFCELAGVRPLIAGHISRKSLLGVGNCMNTNDLCAMLAAMQHAGVDTSPFHDIIIKRGALIDKNQLMPAAWTHVVWFKDELHNHCDQHLPMSTKTPVRWVTHQGYSVIVDRINPGALMVKRPSTRYLRGVK